MIELSRAEFDAWVKSEVGKMFSHGKIASIEFYYLIWKAGMAAGIERAAKRMEPESTNTAITIRALNKEQK